MDNSMFALIEEQIHHANILAHSDEEKEKVGRVNKSYEKIRRSHYSYVSSIRNNTIDHNAA